MLTLQVSVPLLVASMGDWTPEQRQAAASDWAQVIVEKGDVLQYGGKGCAAAFAALAKGIAALAYQPGGVSFAGLHWCVGSGHNGTHEPAPCQAEIHREQAMAAAAATTREGAA